MKNRIAIVGEAWGAEEARQRVPFIGASGKELTRMLSEAGIERASCFLTNVFNFQPGVKNDIETICGPRGEGIPNMPALRAGKYVRHEYREELDRLYRELQDVQPNLILALGNTACWAVLKNSGVSKLRGTISASHLGPKVLPTFHPAAILREWSNRAVTILDLMKAERESHFPEIRRPERLIYIEPSLQDMEDFYALHLAQSPSISFDIETARDQITCIGFAPSPHLALVVPFFDASRPGKSYWAEPSDELRAWAFVKRVLALPCRKHGQNGLYDINFLWRAYGIPVRNYEDDTMLLHHSLQPESNKGLGFLGSLYSNEASWKFMRSKGTIKRED